LHRYIMFNREFTEIEIAILSAVRVENDDGKKETNRIEKHKN